MLEQFQFYLSDNLIRHAFEKSLRNRINRISGGDVFLQEPVDASTLVFCGAGYITAPIHTLEDQSF